MSQIPLFDVAISLIFLYFLMSMLVSGIMEIINSIPFKGVGHYGNRRALMLKKAIDEVFEDKQDKNWSELIYAHPLIESLKEFNKNKDRIYMPSYIPSKIFASALIDVISNEAQVTEYNAEGTAVKTLPYKKAFDNFNAGLLTLNQGDTKVLLQSFLKGSQSEEDLENKISLWFESSMERVSGWFKRNVQRKVIIIAAIFTLIFNVDSLKVSKELWYNATLRERLISEALKTVDNYQNKIKVTPSSQTVDDVITKEDFKTEILIKSTWEDTLYAKLQYFDSLKNILTELNLPIGWKNCTSGKENIMSKNKRGNTANSILTIDIIISRIRCNMHQINFSTILGWVLTIMALSLGAPFWFDLLLRLVNMRNTGKKPESNITI